jgi:DNA-binding protein YbaB
MRVYLLNNHGEYEAGNIYQFDDAEAKGLIENGTAVKVDFPTLQSYENDINRLVAEYRAKQTELKKSERYRDNESERQYQLQKLRVDLDRAVQEKMDDYHVELEALYRENAAAAFNVKVDENAKQFVDAVKLQFATVSNKEDLTDLLIARLKNATPEEKAALSLALSEIQIPENMVQKVRNELKGANPGAAAMLNCEILRKYKETQNPAVAYNTLKVVESRVGRADV